MPWCRTSANPTTYRPSVYLHTLSVSDRATTLSPVLISVFREVFKGCIVVFKRGCSKGVLGINPECPQLEVRVRVRFRVR